MKQVTGFKCDFCNRIFSNKKTCIKHEKHHKEIKEIINMTAIHKQKEKEVINDTSCWYIDPFQNYYKVFNQKAERVNLNDEQGQSDKQFWYDLHLKRKPSDFAWMYECIVYAHNLRNGYISKPAFDHEEAISIVRVHFTDWDHSLLMKEK